MASRENSSYAQKSVFGRHIHLLDLVSKCPKPPTFAELQQASGLPKATLHRFLHTLTNYGLLELNAQSRCYQLGMHLIELASAAWRDHDLRRVASDELAKLRDLTGETVRLAIPAQQEILYIDQYEALNPMRLERHIGNKGPAYCSGTGKAYLAFLAPSVRASLLAQTKLEPLTPRTLILEAALESDFEISRARGFAIDDEEQFEGVRAIGVPILDQSGQPMAAISVTAPSYRVSRSELEAMAPEVIRTAERIAKRYFFGAARENQ